jgi:hypothetical protein
MQNSQLNAERPQLTASLRRHPHHFTTALSHIPRLSSTWGIIGDWGPSWCSILYILPPFPSRELLSHTVPLSVRSHSFVKK